MKRVGRASPRLALALLLLLLAQSLLGETMYRVRPGDTLWRVAKRFHVSADAIKRANGLVGSALSSGQDLRIPGAKASRPVMTSSRSSAVSARGAARGGRAGGGSYVVKSGDSLWSVSRKLGVSVDALRSANGPRAARLAPGMRLVVPGDRTDNVERDAAGARRRPGDGRQPADGGRPADGTRPGRLAWPVRGAVVERFGIGKNATSNGISIKASGKDAVVRAAAAGTVTFSGTLRGYGQLVIVRHPGNLYTVYAHVEGPVVRKGDSVAAGASLANAGWLETARTWGVHFQVYARTKAQNPLTLLPR